MCAQIMLRRRSTRSQNEGKAWSEKDMFDLGLVLGESAARDLGREEAIKALANVLKRREDEVREKLMQIGFFPKEPKHARSSADRSARTKQQKREKR
jgi:hypothetical protein